MTLRRSALMRITLAAKAGREEEEEHKRRKRADGETGRLWGKNLGRKGGVSNQWQKRLGYRDLS